MIQNAAFDRPQGATRDDTMFHLINEVMLQVNFEPPTDFQNVGASICSQWGFVINPIALCCPEFIGGPAAAPSASGPPTLGEQFFPILDTHQIVPVEQDDKIIFETFPTSVDHTIPIDDLAAVNVGPGAETPSPETDRVPTAEEVMPDRLEGFEQVDVRITDFLTGQATTFQSIVDNGQVPIVQAVFDDGGSMDVGRAQQTADMLRLRSLVEHPIAIWTTPKWLKVRLNEVVRVQHLLGTTDFRVTEIEWGADWVLRISGVVWDALLNEPPGTVPSVEELSGTGQDSS